MPKRPPEARFGRLFGQGQASCQNGLQRLDLDDFSADKRSSRPHNPCRFLNTSFLTHVYSETLNTAYKHALSLRLSPHCFCTRLLRNAQANQIFACRGQASNNFTLLDCLSPPEVNFGRLFGRGQASCQNGLQRLNLDDFSARAKPCAKTASRG